MDKTNVTKRVTATILSMSLLTVMAGAAIAPALGIIKAHFSQANDLLGYASYLVPSVAMILIGSAFIGIANGVGVPYLNTIASIKGGKNSATTVMPLLSAALYLGQFVSPLVVIPLSHNLFGADLTAPYKVAILLCLVFLVQVWATRHFQSLPPK